MTNEIKGKMSEWFDWLVEHTPEPIVQKTTSAFKAFKNKINDLYNIIPSKPTAPQMNAWYDWLVNYVPAPIRKPVSKAYKIFKDKIMTCTMKCQKWCGQRHF